MVATVSDGYTHWEMQVSVTNATMGAGASHESCLTDLPGALHCVGFRPRFRTGPLDRHERAITVTDHAQNIEIERKFLVAGDGWQGQVEGTRYRQGYLATSASATVRVRVGGGTAFVTIKGPTAQDTLARVEYEYPIPPSHASTSASISDSMAKLLLLAAIGASAYPIAALNTMSPAT